MPTIVEEQGGTDASEDVAPDNRELPAETAGAMAAPREPPKQWPKSMAVSEPRLRCWDMRHKRAAEDDRQWPPASSASAAGSAGDSAAGSTGDSGIAADASASSGMAGPGLRSAATPTPRTTTRDPKRKRGGQKRQQWAAKHGVEAPPFVKAKAPNPKARGPIGGDPARARPPPPARPSAAPSGGYPPS